MTTFLAVTDLEGLGILLEKSDVMSYFENQSRYTDTYLGKYPMSYNGCGVIALWNYYVFLHKDNIDYNYHYIRKWFNKRVYFGGKFGIMPWQICKFLKVRNHKYKINIIKMDNLKQYLNKNDGNVFIMMYAEKSTAHYIFVDNYGVPHNTYGKTLEDIIMQSPIRECVMINIQWIA